MVGSLVWVNFPDGTWPFFHERPLSKLV